MSRRHIFTERQRAALFDLPTDELSLLKFYTLGDDDLENIRQRRRPENRIGFALQLCALRYRPSGSEAAKCDICFFELDLRKNHSPVKWFI
ncbi:DUF4158 domain-containing protein [Yersinia intermedia]|nr:DUF4158 domain-containing protein [Yersinia intermedia]MCB5324792.1 DUF4158 domain-containing protein [Yersinia intermedia]